MPRKISEIVEEARRELREMEIGLWFIRDGTAAVANH